MNPTKFVSCKHLSGSDSGGSDYILDPIIRGGLRRLIIRSAPLRVSCKHSIGSTARSIRSTHALLIRTGTSLRVKVKEEMGRTPAYLNNTHLFKTRIKKSEKERHCGYVRPASLTPAERPASLTPAERNRAGRAMRGALGPRQEECRLSPVIRDRHLVRLQSVRDTT